MPQQTPASGQVCYQNADAVSKRSSLPSDNSTLLEERGLGTGNPWGLEAGGALTLGGILSGKVDTNLQVNVEKLFGPASEGVFACKQCAGCVLGKGNKGRPCCGCICMDCVYGLSDMPPCSACDIVNTDGGGWPGTGSTTKKRDPSEDDNGDGHLLDKRAAGTATKSTKQVSVCGAALSINGNSRYPAFPAAASWPWDGIENNRYSDVSAYWGNTSADCADWSVGQLTPADTKNTPVGPLRAPYDSTLDFSLGSAGFSPPPLWCLGILPYSLTLFSAEHVFEGQLIGEFFSQWLVYGNIKNQNPRPPNTYPIADCSWTNIYITGTTRSTQTWFDWNNVAVPFINLLLQELGNLQNLDRLTIMLRRPNQVKGRVRGLYSRASSLPPSVLTTSCMLIFQSV